ncbi:MAG TPA: carbohydrate kinase family protein [Acidimicrobiales bacterium]|nr:carbohydrate kinase family protein [Acidimicrobiales bacterium]
MSAHRAHVVGPVCLDLVFSGLTSPPHLGAEVWASSLGVSPGGVANVAVALARLGLDVTLSAVFADDAFGHYLWSSLQDEGVDLAYSVSAGGWSTPVTSSVALDGERSMVTYAEAPPVNVLDLLPTGYHTDALVISLADADAAWLSILHQVAPLVFADVAWEDDEHSKALLSRLAAVDVFMPNAAEALACSRCATVPEAAARLSNFGPLVVVKNGESGSLAMCPGALMATEARAVPVQALDTTGAGDVFDAGFIYATLAGWPMVERLRFANLCGAESVKLIGGSLAAPCWRDLAASYSTMTDPALRRSYQFLDTALADAPARRPCQRSVPGIKPPYVRGGTASKS